MRLGRSSRCRARRVPIYFGAVGVLFASIILPLGAFEGSASADSGQPTTSTPPSMNAVNKTELACRGTGSSGNCGLGLAV